LTKLIVSTDSPEIANISKKYGAEVPFLRPKKLSLDSSQSLPAFQHAIRKMEKNEGFVYDFVVLLQATTPFKNVEDIDQCIEKLIRTKADSVVSVYRVDEMNPIKIKVIKNDKLYPYFQKEEGSGLIRQNLPPIYKRNGGIYSAKRDIVIIKNSLFGNICRPYIMPKERSVDINDNMDWIIAEALIKKYKSNFFKQKKY
jgi:CMP-N-acetylneuraminic acid synthetase